MMKKTALLIGSVAAVALLAGGTFAAYTITDNADPFGVKISPTAIEEDKTGNVTLSWGENTVTKVENIVAASHRKSGNLVLKAENDADAAAIYNGKLAISLEDLTARGEAYAGAKLIDYLTIDIYEGEFATYDAAKAADASQHIQLLPSTEGHALESAAKGDKAGMTYSVFVSLDANAGAPAVWSQINADKVYLQFDWKKDGGKEEVQATTVYVQTPNDWSDNMYVYSWKDDGQIGAFPGKAMTKVSSHLYSYELPDSYANVIFSDVGKDGETILHQTADQARVLGDKQPYFVVGQAGQEGKYGGAWHASVAAHDYYITGVIMGQEKWFADAGYVEEFAMSTEGLENGDLAQLKNYQLKAKDELKIIDKNGVYYGTEGENANWVIEADGYYDIYLNKDGNLWIGAHVNS